MNLGSSLGPSEVHWEALGGWAGSRAFGVAMGAERPMEGGLKTILFYSICPGDPALCLDRMIASPNIVNGSENEKAQQQAAFKES